MTNEEVIYLFQNGAQSVTNRCLDTAQAYKIVKFRNVIKRAFEKYQAEEEALLKECGIMDVVAFENRRSALEAIEARSEEEEKEFVDIMDTLTKYIGMRSELMADEADVSGLKAMPFADWHEFVKENSLDAKMEDMLEGILWTAPEEED